MRDRPSGNVASNTRVTAEFADNIKNATTEFDTVGADVSTSVIDIPSTYPLNSERLNLITEGTVSEDTEFSNGAGSYGLSVNGDSTDAIELRSRQRTTYVPNFELLYGIAYFMENELVAGQRLEIAFADANRDNGYFLRIENDTREAFIKSGGTIIDRTEWNAELTTDDPYTRDTFDETVPQINRTYLSWYGDGAARFSLTSATEDGTVKNEDIAKVANRENVATEEINLFMSVRLECTEATDPNTVRALSMGAVIRGDGSVSNRIKGASNLGLGGDIDTSYTPVLAVRRRANYKNVLTQLSKLAAVPTTKMEVTAVAFPEGSTDATDWDVPPQQDRENTATEQTTNISTFPTDADGNPDGRLMLSKIALSGQGNAQQQTLTEVTEPFYEDEELVFLARTASGTGESIDINYASRQEW